MTPDLLNPTAERQPERKSASHGEAGYKRSLHDAYFTESWVTRALIAAVDFADCGTIWEPACGDGRMAVPLREAGFSVYASDIANWGYGDYNLDFLGDLEYLCPFRPGAVVTNPPFDQAVQFAVRALELTKPLLGKVALLQRHEWDAAIEREPLFEITGGCKYLLPRRPYWIIPPQDMGACPAAAKLATIPTGADGKRISPRFSYAWYVFDWRLPPPWTRARLPDPDKPQASAVLL